MELFWPVVLALLTMVTAAALQLSGSGAAMADDDFQRTAPGPSNGFQPLPAYQDRNAQGDNER